MPALREVEQQQQSLGAVIEPYTFKMSIIEGFRYRVEDVLRTVGRRSIKEARQTEIKAEILNSQKLKTHFEENPTDLEALKHDTELQSKVIKRHLKHIPFYLMPSPDDLEKTLTPVGADEDDIRLRIVHSVRSLKREIRRQDPLRSFQYGKKRGMNQRRGGLEATNGAVKKIKKTKKKGRRKNITKMPRSQFKSNKPKPF
eukprot:TRINITY_DN16237_c0_g1_i1.p1 TRINITY_DN16237_c0_g1~~TRINITY_DN16237_c0_g1_i1.p1  ORF type:complete len:228 (+),score=25.84 TRINITY_DN16237_c0_g1_i1:87-686(+)